MKAYRCDGCKEYRDTDDPVVVATYDVEAADDDDDDEVFVHASEFCSYRCLAGWAMDAAMLAGELNEH